MIKRGIAAVLGILIGFCSAGGITRVHADTPYDLSRDIVYKTIDGVNLKLDICSPKNNTGPKPTLVFFHGGGFRGGDKNQGIQLLCALVTSHGYILASADYRLAPEYVYPTQLDDAQFVIRWLRSKASQYNIDPNRIIVAGSSAGATLAGVVGMKNDTRNPQYGLSTFSSKPQGTIVLAGVYDFTDTTLLGSFNPLDFYFNNNLTFISEFSAVNHVSADDGPVLLLHGTEDTTVLPIQSRRMKNTLAAEAQAAVTAYLAQYFPINNSLNPADLTNEDDEPGDQVNEADYNVLLSDFGKTGSPGWIPADINDDGVVDEEDYNMLVGAFGE